MQVYADMVKYNMVDVIVATGATVVDMDFFEALGKEVDMHNTRCRSRSPMSATGHARVQRSRRHRHGERSTPCMNRWSMRKRPAWSPLSPRMCMAKATGRGDPGGTEAGCLRDFIMPRTIEQPNDACFSDPVYPFSVQGGRIGRENRSLLFASSSPGKVSFSGSHVSGRPSFNAMLPRWQMVDTWCPFSTEK